MFDYRAHDTTAPGAPGDLEVVQRFMNLHEHLPNRNGEVPASREIFEAFLRERRLIEDSAPFTDADRETALELIDALRAKVDANAGRPIGAEQLAVIDDLADRAGLHPRFGSGGPSIVPSRPGAEGALGRLVAIAFLADLDGSWSHLKACAGEECHAVFYDRSKNHSGRWCSMSRCGNRAKVRAWRERQRADDEP
jgi:hypothetical protein